MLTRAWRWWAASLSDPRSLLAWLVVALLIAGICADAARAQVVQVDAEQAYAGWVRATLDRKPPHAAGTVTLPDGDVVPWQLGRTFGADCMTVDLRVDLAAGQRVTLDLRRAVAARPEPFRWPPDLLGWLGGLPHFGGAPMALLSLAQDGAALCSHWRCRVGRMFVADAWLRWYGAAEPWMHGEVTLTCSHPGVPDLIETSGAWSLALGDAVCSAQLAPAAYADGQARAIPVTLHWPRHGGSAPGRVHAVGDVRLWPDGTPQLEPGRDVAAWTAPRVAQARAVLQSWAPMVVGANATSGDTGEQQEQAFTCAEPLQYPRACELVYLSALKYANRPCHHREQDGSLLALPPAHTSPRLVLWDGRPHWHTGVSPDRLGKAATLTPEQASGWWGPDVEHALFSTLAAGARLTGSPALQAELSAIARVYLYQWTVAPGLSTSQPYAARAVGWEGILCSHLWRTLEDRTLALAVADRWRARFGAFAWLLDDLDVRTDDPRLGPGRRWIPWQQAIGAWGLDLAGRVLGREQACTIALQHARTIVQDAYVWRDSRWTTRDVVALDGAETPTGYFDRFGTPLAPQLLLRAEPTTAKAQEIVGQIRREATLEKHARWLVPR